MSSDKHKAVSLYVEPDLWWMLEAFAQTNGRSRSSIINNLIRMFLDQETTRELESMTYSCASRNAMLLEQINLLHSIREQNQQLLDRLRQHI